MFKLQKMYSFIRMAELMLHDIYILNLMFSGK